MNATCHRCGATEPAGNTFRSERIPFLGTKVYCPKCHAKFEEKILIGMFLLNVGLGLIGFVCLLSNPSSEAGHIFANAFLFQVIAVASIVAHEFAHALVGKMAGLGVPRIWIGRGKTIYRLNLFGFDTEFKMVPVGGLTFLTHGFKDKLRFRYFSTILAGPLANAIILVVALRFVSWRNFNIGTSIQFAVIILFLQAFFLVENLLPYRMRTAIGKICTDGLSLFQLLVSESPEVLRPQPGIRVATVGTQTRTE